jgi:hypothetical protein
MTSHSIRTLVLASVAVVALCGSAIAVAKQGQTVEIESAVHLRDNAPAFHGKVTSDNSACAEDRLVKMFKLKSDGSRKLLGTTHSAIDGKWTVPFANLASAEYFAVATRREEGTAGTIFVCLRAKSNVVAVD